jgi:hypothetical protein
MIYAKIQSNSIRVLDGFAYLVRRIFEEIVGLAFVNIHPNGANVTRLEPLDEVACVNKCPPTGIDNHKA